MLFENKNGIRWMALEKLNISQHMTTKLEMSYEITKWSG